MVESNAVLLVNHSWNWHAKIWKEMSIAASFVRCKEQTFALLVKNSSALSTSSPLKFDLFARAHYFTCCCCFYRFSPFTAPTLKKEFFFSDSARSQHLVRHSTFAVIMACHGFSPSKETVHILEAVPVVRFEDRRRKTSRLRSLIIVKFVFEATVEKNCHPGSYSLLALIQSVDSLDKAPASFWRRYGAREVLLPRPCRQGRDHFNNYYCLAWARNGASGALLTPLLRSSYTERWQRELFFLLALETKTFLSASSRDWMS